MAVLRHRDFRNLFIGQSASVIGDGIVVMVGGAVVSIAVLTGGLLVRETWTLRRLERAPA